MYSTPKSNLFLKTPTPTPAESGNLFGTISTYALGLGVVSAILSLIVVILMVVAFWKLFVKAGRPGWEALAPYFTLRGLLEMVDLPGWLSLFLIFFAFPIVGPIIIAALFIMISIKLPQYFGKQPAFAVGLILLPFIFYPILAFGKAEYFKADKIEPQPENNINNGTTQY